MRLLLLSLMSFLTAQAVEAAVPCAKSKAVRDNLAGKFGEAKVATGVIDTGRVMEIWINPKSGTWTVLLTMTNGNSCIMSGGQDFVAERAAKSTREEIFH